MLEPIGLHYSLFANFSSLRPNYFSIYTLWMVVPLLNLNLQSLFLLNLYQQTHTVDEEYVCQQLRN